MKKSLQYTNTHKYKIYNKLINSYTWQLLRRKKFVANPVCEMCAAEGRVTPTEEVHHIKPVESGRDETEMRRLAYDYGNLQSLCKACHAAIHARAKPVPDSARSFAERFFATKDRGGVFFNQVRPSSTNPRLEGGRKNIKKNISKTWHANIMISR